MEQTDPRFAEMAQRAGDLKDQISDTQAVIKATGGTGVETLSKGLAGVGQIGIAAFQGIESSMALMGVESEFVMETMMRLQALAGLGDALETLGGLGDKLTEIRAAFVATAAKMGLFTSAKAVDTTVTVGQTVATEGATVATSGLGKAMKALPIVAIIAGVGAVVAAFAAFASQQAKTSVKQQALNDTMDAFKDAATGAVEQTTKVGNAFKLAREGVMSKKDALALYNKELGGTFGEAKNLNEAEKLYREKTKDYIEAVGLRAQADAILKKSAELSVKKIELQMKYDDLKAKGYGQEKEFLEKTFSLQDDGMKLIEKEMAAADKKAKQYADLSADLTAQAMKKEKENNIIIQSEEKVTKAIEKKNEASKKSFKNADDQVNKTMDLIDKEQQIIDSIDAYETSKQLTSAIETQMQGIEKTGQYSIDLIDELIKKEHDLQAAQIRRKYETQLASKNMLEASNAQMEMDFELSKLDDETAAKRKQAMTDLETAQEDYAAKRLQSEEETAKQLEELQKEQAEKQKQQWENSAKFAEQTANFFVEQSEKKISQIDKEMDAAQKQYDALAELAANGNINAQESLAEQQRIINEANQRKEKEMRRQQRIKLAESVYSTYAAKVASGSKNPLQETMMETALLQTFISSLPTFESGTENTGSNGRGLDGKGGFLSVLHPNERVVPKSLNEQIGSMSNEALAKMAMEYQAGKLVAGNKGAESLQLAILVNEMRDLKQVIQNKPETNIELGEITQSMMEIVKTTKQGNTHTFNRYKVRK
jgi:hypothetical protein